MIDIRRVARLFAPALLSAALASSTLSSAAAETAPVEIPAILPLTGGGAFIGQAVLQTFKVVEKRVNATGGIHGRPLHFVVYDDQSNPQIDVQLASPLIAKHVPVIFDGGPVAMCRAVMPLVANGPVLYCLSPALYPPKGGYAFSTGASSEDETHALMNFFHTRHWKRVAVMTPTDATGQEADRVIHDLLALPENRDLTVVAWEHFAPSDISVAAQLAKIRDARPDVFMAWGTGTPTATEYRGMKNVGLDVPVVGANGNQTYAQMSQWDSILPRQDFMYSLKWPEYEQLRPGPVKAAMAELYGAFKSEGLKPDLGASLAWDPAMIVVSALRSLPEGATAQQLRDHILALHDYPGVNGYYDFRIGNQRGLTIKDCIVVLWDRKAKVWVPVTGSAGKPA